MFFKSTLLYSFITLSSATLVRHSSHSALTAADPEPCPASAPGYSCGQTGKLRKKRLYHGDGRFSVKADTAVECYLECLDAGPYVGVSCYSIAWNPITKDCVRLKKTLAEQGFITGTSDSLYYDRACFNCTYTCPTKLNQNLLSNSGFEEFSPSSGIWSGTYDPVREPGYQSERAYMVAGGYGPSLTQIYPYCPEETYLVSWVYKFIYHLETPETDIYSINLVMQDIIQHYRPTLEQNNTWTNFTTLLHSAPAFADPPPYFASLHFSVQAASYGEGGEFWLDNFETRKIEDPIADPGSIDLISNPGFESGSVDPWQTRCKIISPGYKSKYATKCTGLNQDPLPNLTQTVATEKLAIYILSFDYKAVCSTHKAKYDECFISILLGRPDDPEIRYTIQAQDYTANNTWFYKELSMIPPRSSTQLTIGPYQDSSTDKCSMFFDNISFKKASPTN